MNRMQKISWLMVICMGSGLILSATAVTVGYFMAGFPKAWAGMGFLGIAGFGGLGPLIFKKDPGAVQMDERDTLIARKAAIASFALSYLVFIFTCMGLWEYYRFKGIETISINILPNLVWPPGITAFLSHAIVILFLYSKDNKQMERGVA